MGRRTRPRGLQCKEALIFRDNHHLLTPWWIRWTSKAIFLSKECTQGPTSWGPGPAPPKQLRMQLQQRLQGQQVSGPSCFSQMRSPCGRDPPPAAPQLRGQALLFRALATGCLALVSSHSCWDFCVTFCWYRCFLLREWSCWNWSGPPYLLI